jgi:hypothetical protein
MLRAIIVAAYCCFLSFAAQAQSLSSISQTAAPTGVRNVKLTANLSSLGSTISSNFVGISGEVGDFVNGFYQGTSGQWTSNGFTGNAASYISLVNLLGSAGEFRLGGGSSNVGTAPNITSGMSTSLNSFLGGLGGNWKLIYGLDLNAANSAAAATTAGNLATAVGTANVTFQFGNEPSLNGFTSATYTTAWNSYYTAVSGAVAGVKVAAVDDIINPGWGSVPTVVAGLTPGLAGMSFVSEHWYAFCSGVFASPVPIYLLSQIQMQQFASGGFSGSIGQYLVNTQAYGTTPQRMTETNSLCSRGQAGMSDRLMAAAWFINTAIVLANQGWAGMNVHSVWTGGIGVYNPMLITADNNFTATPIFYGMYLFSKIQGQQIAALAFSNAVSNIAGIATVGGGGDANILAVNNDVSNPVLITPDQSTNWSTANVLRVKGNAGCSEANPTIGGASIGESGAWSGAAFALSKGQSVTLGPCEAALIQIQP